MEKYILNRERWFTVTAARVELGLDDHVDDEMGGLTCLVEEPPDLGLGGHLPIVLELLSDLGGRTRQHQ